MALIKKPQVACPCCGSIRWWSRFERVTPLELRWLFAGGKPVGFALARQASVNDLTDAELETYALPLYKKLARAAGAIGKELRARGLLSQGLRAVRPSVSATERLVLREMVEDLMNAICETEET